MSETPKATKLIHEHRKLQHLLLSSALEESGSPKIVFSMIVCSCSIVVLLFLWALMTRIPEVSTASGVVIPRSEIPVVQHLEGGIIAKVLASDGQMVEQGDPVFILSPAQSIAQLKRLRTNAFTLNLDLLRLDSTIAGEELTWSKIEQALEAPAHMDRADYKKLGDNAIFLQKHANESDHHEQLVLKSRIDQLENEIQNLTYQKENLAVRKTNLDEQVKMHEKLNKKQAVSRVMLLNTNERYGEIQSDYLEVDGLLQSSKNSLIEAKETLTNLKAQVNEEVYRERLNVNKELLEVQDSIEAAQDRVQRLTVISPVKGTIKGLTLDVGSVIPPGGVLFEVVPMDEDLMVEARLSPKEIGHVSIGDEAIIKVSAYNFSRYGHVYGVLEHLSASTFIGEDGAPYYEAKIKLLSKHLGEDEMANRVMPGMTVSADIITGKKSLLSYLLKPVKSTAQEAFRER